MFSFVGMLLAGLVVGICAKYFLPERAPGSTLLTIVLGIAGSILGSWLGQIIGLYGPGQRSGIVMSVIGAITLLSAHRMIRSTV